jgi:menaquinol-cytochrome c reductase iron-sulfur subunit
MPREVEPNGPDRPHLPTPTLWPIGFAVGIAILLTGLVVGWYIVLLGAILAIAFGALWVRDLTTDMRGEQVPEAEPEKRRTRQGIGAAPVAPGSEAALPAMSDEEIESYPRSRFLEASTLGLGAVIGGLVTVPPLALMLVPPFNQEEDPDVDIGGLDAFPLDSWRIVTFLANPAEGEVTRRTAFVRNNGELNGSPSFTIIANNCAHLGCPVQPNGPLEEEQAEEVRTSTTVVRRIPTDPAGGFVCPCHGGAYDNEGNRTSGPPVRSLDRYEFAIRSGSVFLTARYSVANVDGTGKDAVITKYEQAAPGVHVDGPSALLYPIEPPK